ncbi:MAG: hypothetical protein ABIH65_04075 [Nanoarchaeota archaeon]
MGIVDFLRKLTKNTKVEEPEEEKVFLSNLGEWTENKIKDFKIKEKETLVFIQKRIESISDELKEKINAAKSINLNLKKEADRIKSSTEDGRKKYLESVEFLIKNLNDLKKEELEKTIEDTDRIFSYFNKGSKMSYERATILIGKEMAEIKESLKAFSGSLIKIFDENKSLVDSSKVVFLIKLKLILFEKIEQEIKKIVSEIIFLNNKIIEKEKESREILDKIDSIKKSPEYLEKQETQEKLNLFKNELEKDISDLRQLIDFKALGNFYHIFEDKMQIVKSHRDDFQANFQKDNGNNIISLLETARLNNKNITDKLDEMNKKKQEILQLEIQLENEKNKDKENELNSDITKRILEIGDLKNKKLREEKRQEKLKENKEKIINELKESLKKLDVTLFV